MDEKNQDNLVKKIKSGFLSLGNIKTSNMEKGKRYKIIYSNVRDAIKDIAMENPLNKKRVKLLYGIEIDD